MRKLIADLQRPRVHAVASVNPRLPVADWIRSGSERSRARRQYHCTL